MQNEAPPPLAQALAETRSTTSHQIAAAWQLQLSRIEEQLHAGWQDELARILELQFAGLSARFSQTLAGERASQTRRLGEQLRQSLRRIARSSGAEELSSALLDAAAPLAGPVLLLLVPAPDSLRCEGVRNCDASLRGREWPAGSLPAAAHALESKDVVVTLPLASEISADLAALWPEPGDTRIQIFPILARQDCVAILLAEPAEDTSALLESLAVAAGLAWPEPAPEPALAAPQELIAISAAVDSKPPVREITPQEREELLQAQRFARVQVAEMRLYKAAAVKAGRAAGNLYAALKEEIDAGREVFRRRFLENRGFMFDYFHLELVRSLAGGNAHLLGSEYPGPMA